MKSIALRSAFVALVIGAVTLALPSGARAGELDCKTGCSLQPLPLGSTQFGGTALFSTTSIGSTGTGVLDPFIRIQDNNVESGHNTGGALVSDEKAGTWTHDLELNHLPVSLIGGVLYYEFILDANETNNAAGRIIALNNVQICLSNTASLTGTVVSGERTACPGALKYSFGTFGSGATEVKMDYNLSGSGSGAGDLFMYIPMSAIGAPAAGQYLYLFSQFGLADAPPVGDTSAGFEEWAIKSCFPNCSTNVPEPSSLLLLGAGVLGLAAAIRRRAIKA